MGMRTVDLTRRRGGGAMARALVCGAAFYVGGAASAQAEETTLFSDLSTPELLELSADLGEELRTRGVMPNYADPSREYARHLAVRGLELATEPSGLVDSQGLRYRIMGVRRIEGGGPLRSGPLDDLAAANFDMLVIVVFRRDFQIERASLAPIDVVRELATAPDPTAEPTLALDDSLWSAAGVIDVTGPMYLAASQD